MSRITRLAIVLSALWMAGVCTVLLAEYLRIKPGQCVFDEGRIDTSFWVDGIFLSCNIFSDLPKTWWGVAQLSSGQQVIELSTYRLVVALAVPVLAIWFVLWVCPTLWRWVAKGS